MADWIKISWVHFDSRLARQVFPIRNKSTSLYTQYPVDPKALR